MGNGLEKSASRIWLAFSEVPVMGPVLVSRPKTSTVKHQTFDELQPSFAERWGTHGFDPAQHAQDLNILVHDLAKSLVEELRDRSADAKTRQGWKLVALKKTLELETALLGIVSDSSGLRQFIKLSETCLDKAPQLQPDDRAKFQRSLIAQLWAGLCARESVEVEASILQVCDAITKPVFEMEETPFKNPDALGKVFFSALLRASKMGERSRAASSNLQQKLSEILEKRASLFPERLAFLKKAIEEAHTAFPRSEEAQKAKREGRGKASPSASRPRETPKDLPGKRKGVLAEQTRPVVEEALKAGVLKMPGVERPERSASSGPLRPTRKGRESSYFGKDALQHKQKEASTPVLQMESSQIATPRKGEQKSNASSKVSEAVAGVKQSGQRDPASSMVEELRMFRIGITMAGLELSSQEIQHGLEKVLELLDLDPQGLSKKDDKKVLQAFQQLSEQANLRVELERLQKAGSGWDKGQRGYKTVYETLPKIIKKAFEAGGRS